MYHHTMLLLCIALWTTVAAQEPQPIYDYAAQPNLTPLHDQQHQDILKDTNDIHLVEYYADWCGHCRQLAPAVLKAADNLQGLVKVGAVNEATAKKAMADASVTSFPTLKLYLPEVRHNPYTNKPFKQGLAYDGPRTAKGLVDFVAASIPSHVSSVTDGSLSEFVANGTAPKALLFASKPATTLMIKALAYRLRSGLLIGQTLVGEAPKAAAALGVDAAPALFILSSDGDDPLAGAERYSGELKAAALYEFLSSKAAPAPPPADDAATSQPGKGGDLETIDASGVDEAMGLDEAWLLVFGEVSGLDAVASSTKGQMRVARAADELRARLGAAAEGAALVSLPYGAAAKASGVRAFGGDDKSLAEAKKATLESLPSDKVTLVTPGARLVRRVPPGGAHDSLGRGRPPLLGQAVSAAALARAFARVRRQARFCHARQGARPTILRPKGPRGRARLPGSRRAARGWKAAVAGAAVRCSEGRWLHLPQHCRLSRRLLSAAHGSARLKSRR